MWRYAERKNQNKSESKLNLPSWRWSWIIKEKYDLFKWLGILYSVTTQSFNLLLFSADAYPFSPNQIIKMTVHLTRPTHVLTLPHEHDWSDNLQWQRILQNLKERGKRYKSKGPQKNISQYTNKLVSYQAVILKVWSMALYGLSHTLQWAMNFSNSVAISLTSIP